MPSAQAQSTAPSIVLAPTCVTPGATFRIVVLGSGWADGVVALALNVGRVTTPLGTATAVTSTVTVRPGSFSFTAIVTISANPMRITAMQGNNFQAVNLGISSTGSCPLQIGLTPACLGGPGLVTVGGTGFGPGPVEIYVDPYGPAETAPQAATADKAGVFTTAVFVPFAGVTVPIVVVKPSPPGGIAFVPPGRAVTFVGVCPPPQPTTTIRTTTTSTTAPKSTSSSSSTTITTTVGPTVTVPPPVASVPVQVSISPNTVRPGRCAVIVVAAAPPTVPVVVKFADRAPVAGQTAADGRAVVSICEPHNSGEPLGPVSVLVGVGSAAPIPMFTVLRVPARPQPPLLTADADSRRS